jgi:hypothetical protein
MAKVGLSDDTAIASSSPPRPHSDGVCDSDKSAPVPSSTPRRIGQGSLVLQGWGRLRITDSLSLSWCGPRPSPKGNTFGEVPCSPRFVLADTKTRAHTKMQHAQQRHGVHSLHMCTATAPCYSESGVVGRNLWPGKGARSRPAGPTAYLGTKAGKRLRGNGSSDQNGASSGWRRRIALAPDGRWCVAQPKMPSGDKGGDRERKKKRLKI